MSLTFLGPEKFWFGQAIYEGERAMGQVGTEFYCHPGDSYDIRVLENLEKPESRGGVTFLSHTSSSIDDVTMDNIVDDLGRTVGRTYRCNGTGMVQHIYDVTFQVSLVKTRRQTS